MINKNWFQATIFEDFRDHFSFSWGLPEANLDKGKTTSCVENFEERIKRIKIYFVPDKKLINPEASGLLFMIWNQEILKLIKDKLSPLIMMQLFFSLLIILVCLVCTSDAYSIWILKLSFSLTLNKGCPKYYRTMCSDCGSRYNGGDSGGDDWYCKACQSGYVLYYEWCYEDCAAGKFWSKYKCYCNF